MELFALPYLTTGATTGLLFAILVFSHLIITRRSRAIRSPKPPQVSGGWPLLGHLHLLGGLEQLPHITLGALTHKYGPIFTINIGIHSALVLNTWELAKECFTTNDLVVSSRPMTLAGKYLGYNYAVFGFGPYSPYCREMRKLTSLELLSNSRLQLLKHVRVSEVEMSLKQLYKQWSQRKDIIATITGHLLVEMKQWFGDLSLNVVLRMIAGKRYFNVADGNSSDEKEARRCQKAMREFFHLGGLFVLGDAVPWLKWWDLGGHQKAMKDAAKELDLIVMEWLEEHKHRRTTLGKAKSDQDFMDVMLSVLDGSVVAGFDADTVVKATCVSLMTGGTDTTTVTLTWALSLLLNHPHVLKKIHEELDNHVGKERLVNESDINNLEYLRASVKETLRLCPAGPLSGLREFSEDCTVGGYHVPRGTWLMTNLSKVHTDPRVWTDHPMEFKPERFITTHRGTDVKGQNFELMPFGSGRRACPGITLGLQVTLLSLAGFLHGFEVSTPGNEPVDMTGSIGLTNMKSTHFKFSSNHVCLHIYINKNTIINL